MLKDEDIQMVETSSGITNNNNNNIVDARHHAMVANILLNKDLTVEVKPVRVKPVVLAPRHPEGNSLYHGRQPSPAASNSVVVSVQPRQERQAPVLPPPGRPHSVPRMVEEWFKKMQPPIASPPPVQPPSPVCFDALNLSVKVSADSKFCPPASAKSNETVLTGRATQIYLRPISSIQSPAKTLSRVESPALFSQPPPPPLSPPRYLTNQ